MNLRESKVGENVWEGLVQGKGGKKLSNDIFI